MKKTLIAVIAVTLLSWPIWQYFSHSLEVKEEGEVMIEVVQVESASPEKEVISPINFFSPKTPVQDFDEKLNRLEEKYMARMETLVRLLEAHDLQNQTIGDEMPKDLPQEVERAWKAYLITLSGLEKLKTEENSVDEEFIKMAHQGLSIKLIEI